MSTEPTPLTPQDYDALLPLVTAERLGSYVRVTKGTTTAAFELYEWNMRAAASVMELTSMVRAIPHKTHRASDTTCTSLTTGRMSISLVRKTRPPACCRSRNPTEATDTWKYRRKTLERSGERCSTSRSSRTSSRARCCDRRRTCRFRAGNSAEATLNQPIPTMTTSAESHGSRRPTSTRCPAASNWKSKGHRIDAGRSQVAEITPLPNPRKASTCGGSVFVPARRPGGHVRSSAPNRR